MCIRHLPTQYLHTAYNAIDTQSYHPTPCVAIYAGRLMLEFDRRTVHTTVLYFAKGPLSALSIGRSDTGLGILQPSQRWRLLAHVLTHTQTHIQGVLDGRWRGTMMASHLSLTLYMPLCLYIRFGLMRWPWNSPELLMERVIRGWEKVLRVRIHNQPQSSLDCNLSTYCVGSLNHSRTVFFYVEGCRNSLGRSSSITLANRPVTSQPRSSVVNIPLFPFAPSSGAWLWLGPPYLVICLLALSLPAFISLLPFSPHQSKPINPLHPHTYVAAASPAKHTSIILLAFFEQSLSSRPRMPALEPRWYDDECWIGNDGRRYCNRSAWNDWVRWVVLAVIVIGFFLLFVLCSCITARRRRKLGRQPYYGTGWASRNNQQHNAQPYYNNQYNQPAPPYSAQPQGGYYSNNNTYGQPQYGQQNGIDLQSPQPAYNQHRGGDDVYSPPSGPPPGKGDGIVR